MRVWQSYGTGSLRSRRARLCTTFIRFFRNTNLSGKFFSTTHHYSNWWGGLSKKEAKTKWRNS
jgi:hypothetical protein